MSNNFQGKTLMPLFTFFIMIDIICVVFGRFLDQNHIDHLVLLTGNIVLFLLTFFNLFRYSKAIQNSNPNVFSRSVMSSTILKLFVLGGGIFTYLILAKETRSLYAVVGIMILYIFYTIIEVRNALKMNRQTNVRS